MPSDDPLLATRIVVRVCTLLSAAHHAGRGA